MVPADRVRPLRQGADGQRGARQWRDRTLRDILARMRHDGCGGLAAKAELLTGIEAMERHGHLHLALEVRMGLLGMSAATIDRALRDVRERTGGRKRRHASRRLGEWSLLPPPAGRVWSLVTPGAPQGSPNLGVAPESGRCGRLRVGGYPQAVV